MDTNTKWHDYITQKFPYYRNRENQTWRKSIRSNLSAHECFVKLPAKGESGKSHYWVFDPNYDEEGATKKEAGEESCLLRTQSNCYFLHILRYILRA